MQNAIIEEGFSEPTDFLLEKSDIDDMINRIASLPTGRGGVHIGQFRLKKLLVLVWWIKDQVRRDQEILLLINASNALIFTVGDIIYYCYSNK